MKNSMVRPSNHGLILASLAAFSINNACVNSVTQNRQSVAEITKKTETDIEAGQVESNPPVFSENVESQTEAENVLHCVYSGIIKVNMVKSQPTIKIEKICIDNNDGFVNLTQGEHKEVHSDQAGHFPIPFRDSYLVLEGEVPYLVYQNDGLIHKTGIQHIGENYYSFEMIAIGELRPIIDDSWLIGQQKTND